MARLRRRFMRPAALPLALLLLALSTVFLSSNDRGQFYRGGYHSVLTSNHMAVGENLSPKHHFLGFYSLTLNKDGAPSYRPYNRFPIGGYALLKLAILPFEGDISASLHSARILMLVFFIGVAVLAWLALCRLTGDRWIALTATLLSFSSFWLLYYNDMVATESMPDLFGVMLAFHGMVVFVQEGRFRQLLVKACAALLLGWHVYALLLAFILLGLARDFIRALPLTGSIGPMGVRAVVPKTGRYLTLGAAALLFGAVLLSFNFGNEYLALGGKIPLAELPSVKSMICRLGVEDCYRSPSHADALAWPSFLEAQLRRIGAAMFPFAWIEPIWGPQEPWQIQYLRGMFTSGIAAAGGVCLTALPFVRHRVLLAALAVSGVCWALPMRHHTYIHDFESMFYVGIPLVFFTLVCLCARRLAGRRSVFVLAAAAFPVFVLSSVKMASVGHHGLGAIADAEQMQDFQVIRDVLGEGAVFIPPGQRLEIRVDKVRHYLAGSVVLFPMHGKYMKKAGFLLLRHRDEGPALLTPDNRRMFLYGRVLYEASWDAPALGDPIIESDWSVHLKDGRLVYVSGRCANRKAPFFLSMVPREAEGLPEHGQRRGVDRMEFRFRDFARIGSRGCVVAVDLPEYELASIRTGQSGEEGRLWEGEYRFQR